MDPLSVQEIAEMCQGKLLEGGSPNYRVSHFSKDTRTLKPGDMYIALRGPNFDGNQFLAEAEARGAVAALIDNASAIPVGSKLTILLVADSLAALQQLARAWRARIPTKVVCITGSSGKTSTKEFTAAVLASRYSVSRNEGNYNNHIGLPLSILATSSSDETAVWEIGMNHAGEILPLVQMARPQIGIITNIGVAHIENLGSREAIAEEKGQLISQIAFNGALILSSEDDFSEKFASRSHVRTILAGLNSGALTASDIQLDFEGTRFIAHYGKESAPVNLRVTGRHMAKNALLALAAGIELGIPLSEGAAALSTASLVGARLRLINIRGIHFLDDSYNANPQSMIAALETVAEMPCKGRRFAILGVMGELGSHAEEGYNQVAKAAMATSFDFLVAIGEKARPLAEAAASMKNVHHLADTSAAAKFLHSVAKPGDLILVKGSNAARVGRVIEQFTTL